MLRINKLLVRLIRGKSCQRPQQMGQDFPRGVLVFRNYYNERFPTGGELFRVRRQGTTSAYIANRARLERLVADRNTRGEVIWRTGIVLATADGFGTVAIMRRRVRPPASSLCAPSAAFQIPGRTRSAAARLIGHARNKLGAEHETCGNQIRSYQRRACG